MAAALLCLTFSGAPLKASSTRALKVSRVLDSVIFLYFNELLSASHAADIYHGSSVGSVAMYFQVLESAVYAGLR